MRGFIMGAMLVLGACAGLPAPTTPPGEETGLRPQQVVYATGTGAFVPEAARLTPTATGYREGQSVLMITGDTVEHRFVAAGEFQPGIGYPATTSLPFGSLGGRTGRVRGYVSEGDEQLLLVMLCSDTDRLPERCDGPVVNLHLPSAQALGILINRLQGGPRRTGGLLGTVVFFNRRP
jgi:hypothetical protein